MSINWWLDKQNVVRLYYAVLFNQKEWSNDTCHNMNEPQEDSNKQENADIKAT